jgi:hypothetical protein
MSDSGLATAQESLYYYHPRKQLVKWKPSGPYGQGGSSAAPRGAAKPNDQGKANPNSTPSGSSTTQVLDLAVSKPFHKLNDKKWLQDRLDNCVFTLLIYTYWLYLSDTHNFDGGIRSHNSTYTGLMSSEPTFWRFLRDAEAKPNLLPPWSTRENAGKCVQSGVRDLTHAVNKGDIVARYGDR